VYLKGTGANRTWYGVFREDVSARGKIERRQRKVRIGTLTEVPSKNAALNILAKIMDIVPKTDTTFQQLAARWQNAVGPTYKKTTIDTYVRLLNANVLPLFKDTRIDTISNEMIQNHLTKAAKNYSKTTLHMMMVVLGQILKWACTNDLIQKNPCIGIKLPQVTNTERCLTRRVVSQEQIDALVAELPEPYATLVLALSQTGLRIGEAGRAQEGRLRRNAHPHRWRRRLHAAHHPAHLSRRSRPAEDQEELPHTAGIRRIKGTDFSDLQQ